MTPFILAVVLAASTPTSAPPAGNATQVATNAPAAQSNKDDPDKVICHREDKIGSNIQVRTCKTRAQWDQEEQEKEQFLRDVDRSSSQAVMSNGSMGGISGR